MKSQTRKRILILYLSFWIFSGMITIARANSQDQSACGTMTQEEIYSRLKKEVFSHNSYTATYFHSSERGKRHEIFFHGKISGKYFQKPLVLCEKRLKVETSFPEQAGAGEQECYSETDDLVRILMPGAYRALGVITLFPEDPKASYINGENLSRTSVWTWFKDWDRMLEGGKLSAKCETRNDRNHWVLSIVRGKNPDPVYNHNEVRIWIDTQLWFPVRVEKYVPNDPKPVVVLQFEELIWDSPQKPDEIKFEGVAPKWSLVSASGGPELNALMPQEPILEDLDGIDPDSFIERLDKSLAQLKDYSTEMTLELRYMRLRQYRKDQFLFIKQGNAFSALTKHLETNYIQLNTGEGFKTIYDPTKDNLLHIIPAGVYKFMAEQTFPLDDPRLFSAIGDNIINLNFFAIRAELENWRANSNHQRLAMARYGNLKGPWMEISRKNQGIPAYPSLMRVMLDEKTSLPALLEYRGYDDPKAFLIVRFSNTKINPGIKHEILWK